MNSLTTYLTFDGNCHPAMKFYQQCLGAELVEMSFADMPGDVPPDAKNRIMHAKLTVGKDTILMASDTMPGMPFTAGNNFSISIDCKTLEEIERLFKALAEHGKVTMALHDAFWGARFGMLTDQFGIHWMFNLEQPARTEATAKA